MTGISQAIAALVERSRQRGVSMYAGLSKLPRLNTLVLKGNALQGLGHSLDGCTGLKKLSLGHNALSSLGPALHTCRELHELRLSHNLLASLPSELAACSRLRILDAGHNPIANASAVTVRPLPCLPMPAATRCVAEVDIIIHNILHYFYNNNNNVYHIIPFLSKWCLSSKLQLGIKQN